MPRGILRNCKCRPRTVVQNRSYTFPRQVWGRVLWGKPGKLPPCCCSRCQGSCGTGQHSPCSRTPPAPLHSSGTEEQGRQIQAKIQIQLFGFSVSGTHTQLSAVSIGLQGICTKGHSPSFWWNWYFRPRVFHYSYINSEHKTGKIHTISNLEHC